jgi:hypothetical protein
VKSVEESEKWVTRTQGGGRKNENDWWDGKKSENEVQKDLITYVDKPTGYVGLG